MKTADYDEPPRKQAHQIASIVILALFLWLTFTSQIPGANVRFAAAQVIATGFIWFCTDYITIPYINRLVSVRTTAWLLLLGIYPAIWLFVFCLKFLAS